MKQTNRKKKLTFLLSCLVLLLCLAACSPEDGNRTSEDDPATLEDETPALTKWYDGKFRTQLEQQINSAYEDQGLKFFFTVEEPDVIVYNYQYASDLSFDPEEYEGMASLLKTFLDSTAPTVKSDIAQYRDVYHLPVKVIRMVYLDPDGNTIVSLDVDESYEPSDNALTGQYDSLEDWVSSGGKDGFASAINSSFEQMGLTLAVDFEADGDTLILIYRFTEQQDIPDFTREELQTYFAQNMAPSLGESAASMLDGLETMLGFRISDIRIQARNADGTLLGEVSLNEMQGGR